MIEINVMSLVMAMSGARRVSQQLIACRHERLQRQSEKIGLFPSR